MYCVFPHQMEMMEKWECQLCWIPGLRLQTDPSAFPGSRALREELRSSPGVPVGGWMGDLEVSCEWPSPGSPRDLPHPFLAVLSPDNPSAASPSIAVNRISPKAAVAIPRQAEGWPVPSQLFNEQHLLGSPVRVSGSPWNAFWAENQIILGVTWTFGDISCQRNMVELHNKYWFPFITAS